MIFTIGNGYSFKVSHPMAISLPKRMYIVIPNANAETIGNNLILSEVAIDGKRLSEYNRVIYVQQRDQNVLVCLGG